MNLFNNPQSPNSPQKFKIVVEAPETSFTREFATLKTLRQFQRRNAAVKATEYIFHENRWERFVIHGSQLIPEPVLRSLLASLNS